MEQKKILWILLSVTLFLFIVSITGIVWFYPGRVASLEEDTELSDHTVAAMDLDPVELLRNGDGFLGLSNSILDDKEEFSIIYGETEEGEAALDLVAEVKEDEIVEDTTSVISSSGVKQKPVKPVATPTSVVPYIPPAPISVVPHISPAPSSVAAQTPKKINVTEYWIQAGSFSSRSRADSSSQYLSEKGFSNLITVKTVDGNDFYRVRMGPYSSKSEAEKFLGWTKEIDSYENSYISQVYIQKTVGE